MALVKEPLYIITKMYRLYIKLTFMAIYNKQFYKEVCMDISIILFTKHELFWLYVDETAGISEAGM